MRHVRTDNPWRLILGTAALAVWMLACLLVIR